MLKFLCQVLDNFYRGVIDSILPENIKDWHGMRTAQDRRALQQVIKTAQNILVTHQPSISDFSEVRSLQSPKNSEKQYLLQPQPVHHAAVWQAVHKCQSPELSTHPLHYTINK